MAALAAARAGDEPGKCQQVWCPFCALAALVTGEQHPLLTVIAEHSVGLADRSCAPCSTDPAPAADRQPDRLDSRRPSRPEAPAAGYGRYQHIPDHRRGVSAGS